MKRLFVLTSIEHTNNRRYIFIYQRYGDDESFIAKTLTRASLVAALVQSS